MSVDFPSGKVKCGRRGYFLPAYITLAIALAAEGASWLRALAQTRREAREAQLLLRQYVRTSRDPNVKMVLFEDAVAVWMGHDTSELLIGAAARPDEREALAKALEEFDQVDAVVEILTMALGPNSLLVAARIDMAPGLTDGDIEQLSDEIDDRLREVVPDVTEVFLDATTALRGSGSKPRPARGLVANDSRRAAMRHVNLGNTGLRARGSPPRSYR